jgi:predicted house-cleaning noncanonical NTP pyrophosphatase (MazG superfamily)
MAKNNIPQDLKFDDLSDYQSIINKLNKRPLSKHLILGNGFSMAYDSKIFSYNALYDFIDKLEDKTLSKLFEVINTKNFELVMRQLDNFIEIAQAFDNTGDMVKALKNANKILQQSLIEAVSSLHPEHVFDIPDEESQSCNNFIQEYLSKGGKVFSTNYDLLLYWILMRNNPQSSIDGFGREHLNPVETKKGEEAQYDDLLWGKHKDTQTVFYLHGTLPIFDTGTAIEKEIYRDSKYLLSNIKERMERKEYPIFVTAGNGAEKLNHIFHNRYLTFCYEQLSKITGSLVSFGFNFGNYDEHIIEALNKAAKRGAASGEKLFSVYIGVYSEQDLTHIKSIQHKFDCKVNVYNAQTANIWR